MGISTAIRSTVTDIVALALKTTAKMNVFFVLTLLLATVTVVYSAAAPAVATLLPSFRCQEITDKDINEIRYTLYTSDSPLCVGYYYCKKGMEGTWPIYGRCPSGMKFDKTDQACKTDAVTC